MKPGTRVLRKQESFPNTLVSGKREIFSNNLKQLGEGKKSEELCILLVLPKTDVYS